MVRGWGRTVWHLEALAGQVSVGGLQLPTFLDTRPFGSENIPTIESRARLCYFGSMRLGAKLVPGVTESQNFLLCECFGCMT